MRAAFFTLGCKVNQYETEWMRELLQKNGFEIVEETDCPDVFIINSCTVTAESDRKTRQMVRKYRRLLPNAVIVLTGCMPQAFPEDAKRLDAADIVLGNASNNELLAAIQEYLLTNRRVVRLQQHTPESVGATIGTFYHRTKAFLKIEDGCDRFCSYCIIPYARGRVRSKPMEQIKQEVQALANAGYKEVVLIGINLSAYGKETGLTLADAVECAAGIPGIARVRLGSMEPDQFTDDVISRLAAVDKLCPQFHLSLQSGCDKTLKAMNRHYDTQFYRNLIEKLRTHFQNAAITTDVMVGFAGESDADFEQSRQFVKEIGFAKTHVFAYSRRKGTVADRMDGQIAAAVKRQRSHAMLQTAQNAQNAFLQTQLGGVYPVLFETRSKDGYIEGYTPNYTLIKVKMNQEIGGQILPVRLTSIEGDGCLGEIITG